MSASTARTRPADVMWSFVADRDVMWSYAADRDVMWS